MYEHTQNIVNLGIDWLQIYVYLSPDSLFAKLANFELKRKPFASKHWKSIYSVFRNGREVAVLACEPASSILHPQGALVKFLNDTLYCSELRTIVEDTVRTLKLIVQSISRLDVCCDFLQLDNEDYRQPSEMIRNFAGGKIDKTGRYNEFDLRGRSGMNCKKYHAIRFGSHDAPVRYYMYNKTLELKDKKDKPYIKDTWRMNGWNGQSDVWRIEFSMKSKALEFSNEKLIAETTQVVKKGKTCKTKKGKIYERETFVMGLRDLFSQGFINAIFTTMLEQYFTFVETEAGKEKRKCKRIKLLDTPPTTYRRIRMPVSKDSSKMDKFFIRKMNALNDELRGIDITFNSAMRELLIAYVKSRGLEDWARSGVLSDYGKRLEIGNHNERNIATALGGWARENRMEAFDRDAMPEHYRNLDQIFNLK